MFCFVCLLVFVGFCVTLGLNLNLESFFHSFRGGTLVDFGILKPWQKKVPDPILSELRFSHHKKMGPTVDGGNPAPVDR